MAVDFTKLTGLQRLLYRELYIKDFYSFVKDFWQECDPAPFVDGKLIQFYCEVAQYAMRQWLPYEGPEKEIILPQPDDNIDIIDVRENKNNYNINVPPRHTKSKIFNVFFGVWCWLLAPLKMASVSHTEGLASKMNAERQKVINSDRFKFFFPEIQLLTNKNDRLLDTRGGELYSINRNAMTGYGADIIVNDDLTNAEAARKDKAEMANACAYYHNTMPSRINNPDTGIILNIQQRLAPNDITGMILNDAELRNRYVFIVLPAIFKKKTYLVCPISGDVFIYDIGDPLWPERFGDYAGLRAQVGETVFNCQYLQNPSESDKTIIKEYMIREEDCTNVPGWDVSSGQIDLQNVDIVYAGHDFPVKDKVTSDFLGSTLCYRVKKTLYFVECLEIKQSFSKSKQYVKQLDDLMPGIVQIIEDKANGSPLMNELQDEVPGMVAFQPGSDSKEERLSYAQLYIESGNVVLVRTKWDEASHKWVLNEGLSNLKQRLVNFPFVEHDDIVDAFDMPILYVFQDVRYSVYGRSFNDLNIVNKEYSNYDYDAVFFNKDGDNWKVANIGIKYDLESKLVVLKEETFKADIESGLKHLKSFAPDKNVFIDCSISETMTGVFDDELIIDRYAVDDFEKSTADLNRAFGLNKILVRSNCKLTQADIESVKYDKRTQGSFKTQRDGFVSCIRTAMKYFGGI